ncbi:hypothetical protein RB595_007014 [Gaeumannomyces hyphopodioides]
MATSPPVQLPEVERLSPACIRILGGNPAADPRTADARIHKSQRRWGDAALDVVRDAFDAFDSAGQQAQQLDIADGHVFRAEGATLTAVHTPGHTADHVALLLAEEDACLTADCVLGHGTAVFEDLAAYVTSLRRLQPLFGGRVYPGHGAVVERGPDRIAEYIAHRQQREDQVLDALRGAAAATTTAGDGTGMTAMELVKIIYSNVHEDLHSAAERGVLQILAKLQGEDKVVAGQGEAWRLKARSTL